MKITDLVPGRLLRGRPSSHGDEGPSLLSLQREMNRLFEDFFQGFDLSPFGGETGVASPVSPRIDVSQTDAEIQVTAELPGMDENDLDVSLSDNVLTIRGEKKIEQEEKEKDYYRMERAYGSFHRAIPLPAEVDLERVAATFKKGVLTVVLAKVQQSESTRKITVRRSE